MKPYLTVEWNDTETDAKGWMVIHNFVKGYTGGGIRMHPSVTLKEVERLAETMAYKYKACESQYCGGCKGGIAYDSKASDAKAVLRRYLIAMMPYIKAGVSLGGDLGTKYGDMLEVFQEFGFEMPLTKSMAADPQIEKNMQAYNKMLDLTVDGRPVNDIIAGYGVACAAGRREFPAAGHRGAVPAGSERQRERLCCEGGGAGERGARKGGASAGEGEQPDDGGRRGESEGD